MSENFLLKVPKINKSVKHLQEAFSPDWSSAHAKLSFDNYAEKLCQKPEKNFAKKSKIFHSNVKNRVQIFWKKTFILETIIWTCRKHFERLSRNFSSKAWSSFAQIRKMMENWKSLRRNICLERFSRFVEGNFFNHAVSKNLRHKSKRFQLKHPKTIRSMSAKGTNSEQNLS